jgi:O-antigen/teichoic acid export membrane protein
MHASRSSRSLSDRAGFLVTANIVKFAIGIVMPVVLVRLLSHRDYGTYQQMVLVSTASVALLTFGLPTSVFYFKSAVGREGMPALIVQTSGLLLVGGVTATAAVYFGAAPLSRLLNNPGMAHLLAIYGLSIGLVIASEHSLSFLISMDRYGRAVLFEVGEAVMRAILLLAPLWLGFGFTGLVVSVVIYAAIRFAVRTAYLFLRSGVSFTGLSGHWFVREQLDYSAPIAVMYVITAAGSTFNRGLLASSFTPADYAVFAVGSVVFPLATIFQSSVASVLRAELPALVRDGQLVEVVRIVRESTRKLSIIMLPGFVFALAHSYEVITVLFTNSYARSVNVFRICVFEMPLDMLILSAIPQICGKTRANMRVNFASATFLIVCSYGLLKSIGFYGVPIAGILTQYFAASLFLIVVLRLLHTTLWKLLPFPQMLRALAASAVAALASCLVPALSSSSLVNLLIEALVFGIVFAVVGGLAGVFTENDRRLIRRWLAKVLPIGAG